MVLTWDSLFEDNTVSRNQFITNLRSRVDEDLEDIVTDTQILNFVKSGLHNIAMMTGLLPGIASTSVITETPLDISEYENVSEMLADGWSFVVAAETYYTKADVGIISGLRYKINGSPSYKIFNGNGSVEYTGSSDGTFIASGTGMRIISGDPTAEDFSISTFTEYFNLPSGFNRMGSVYYKNSTDNYWSLLTRMPLAESDYNGYDNANPIYYRREGNRIYILGSSPSNGTLRIYGSILPEYPSTGESFFNIPDQYLELLYLWCEWKYWRRRREPDEAAGARNLYLEMVKRVSDEVYEQFSQGASMYGKVS